MIENNPSLLGHPLYHALITTEWSNIKSVVIVLTLFMTAFVAFITRLVLLQTNQLQEYSHGGNESSTNICRQKVKSNQPLSLVNNCSPSSEFLAFYILSWVLLFAIVLREGLQWIALGIGFIIYHQPSS